MILGQLSFRLPVALRPGFPALDAQNRTAAPEALLVETVRRFAAAPGQRIAARRGLAQEVQALPG